MITPRTTVPPYCIKVLHNNFKIKTCSNRPAGCATCNPEEERKDVAIADGKNQRHGVVGPPLPGHSDPQNRDDSARKIQGESDKLQHFSKMIIPSGEYTQTGMKSRRIISLLCLSMFLLLGYTPAASALYEFEGIPLKLSALGAVQGEVLTFGTYGLAAAPVYARKPPLRDGTSPSFSHKHPPVRRCKN
jgi:hypothetical protein